MALGRDGIAGLILLAISLVLLVQTFYLPHMPLVPVGPGFYPRIVMGFMAIASATLIVQDVMARRGAGRPAAGTVQRWVHPLVLSCFVIVGAYCFLLPVLGFRIATPIFVAGMQAAIEPPRGATRWAWLAAIALGTTAVAYLAFESYLLVLLPRGSLTGW